MKKITFLSIIMVILFSITIFAQRRQQRPAGTRTKAFDNIRLNLTEEQKNSIKELDQNWRKERGELNKNMRDARLELRKLMNEKDINELEVNQKVEKINSIRSELFSKNNKVNLEKRKIFTDEQRGKLQSLRKFRVKSRIQPGRMAYNRIPPVMNRNLQQFPRFFNRRFDMQGRRPYLRGSRFYNNPRFFRAPRQRLDRWFDTGLGYLAPDIIEEDMVIKEATNEIVSGSDL
ncbi:Spy/CpxP family protein refolding chaperone [candidate division KSB1 bacterium]